MTCAQLHAHERFAANRAEWNKEYRRIYTRRLRGTFTAEDWSAWAQRSAGGCPGTDFYIPYDLWKAHDDLQGGPRRGEGACREKAQVEHAIKMIRRHDRELAKPAA